MGCALLDGVATLVGRPFDLEDLSETPSDANRYEVLDGALVVTAPRERPTRERYCSWPSCFAKPPGRSGFEPSWPPWPGGLVRARWLSQT